MLTFQPPVITAMQNHPTAAHAVPSRVPVRVQPVSTSAQLSAALSVRRRVFIQELGIPSTEEFDHLDKWPLPPNVTHYLVTCNNQPIATCRLAREGGRAKLERMAVDKGVRRRGVGHALLKHIESVPPVQEAIGPLFCYAMKDKELFYRNSGWSVEHGHGAIEDAGIPHVVMIRRRRPRGAAGADSLSLAHVMIRTTDLRRARRFYSLLGFEDVSRFKTSGLRAVWMQSAYIEQRLELIEVCDVPGKGSQPDRSVNPLGDTTPGLGHLSLDLSRACTNLTVFLQTVHRESTDRFGLGLRILEKPRQAMLGSTVVEVAFMADADGTTIELMRFMKKLVDRLEFDAEW